MTKKELRNWLLENVFTKDGKKINAAFLRWYKGKEINYDEYQPLSLDNIKEDVKSIVESMKDAPRGAIIGKVMAKYKGKVDGKELSEFINSLF